MEHPHRKPNRLKNHDYSQNGAYFITICVHNRKPILSRITMGETPGLQVPPRPILSPLGNIVQTQLLALPNRYQGLSIDHYVIMPNHIHILLKLIQHEGTGGGSPSPTVFDIIRVFKSLTTRECKKINPIDQLFQRSYYDHIIRDEYDYQIKWEYIDKNPERWYEDSLYTEGND